MIVYGGVLASLVLGALLSVVFIKPTSRARQLHENAASTLLIAASALAVLVTVGLVLALLGQAGACARIFLCQGPRLRIQAKLGAIPVFFHHDFVGCLGLCRPSRIVFGDFMSEMPAHGFARSSTKYWLAFPREQHSKKQTGRDPRVAPS